jgi:DNA topoisomerase-3
MDKNQIGTDATIHEHIKTIQDRKYAKKQGGIYFYPTELGLALVETYERLGHDLPKPDLRAKMERMMNEIAKGNL